MVSTRRMESGGTGHHSGIPHRTRQRPDIVEKEQSSEDSDGEDSPVEDSKPIQAKRKLPAKVRQLRSRYVCRDLEYANHHIRKRVLRSSHKRIDQIIYPIMGGDSDIYNDHDSEEEVYQPRKLRIRHVRETNLERLERRTALSLRPITMSFVDSHSPLAYNDDSDAEHVVRRSTRIRKPAYENDSWLTDNQMVKVGYPNLNMEYSEEDSRDAQEKTNTSRLSRPNRRQRIFTFENSSILTRKRSRNEEKTPNLISSKDGKENNAVLENRLNGRLRSSRIDKETTDVKVEMKDNHNEVESEKNKNKENGEGTNGNEDKEEKSSSESEDPGRMRTRRQVNTRVLNNEKFTSDANRNRKISESSSSSEVGRVYSLRNRPPKPPSNNIRTRTVRELAEAISRRRFNRRRKQSSSSSSDSSDSDEPRRGKNKSSKTYSKNDQRMKSGLGSKIIPIGPEKLDSSVRFNSIGGLDDHIRCLREMIILPMMYPEVFRQFVIQPPRGVLFHGPPGTGKTLIARALASECSFGSRKISFFMRKGADLLSKWIGESEKQLRLLFEQAQEMKPSIIFFDELDGLAPVRSSRQDQVHASIVSTLLALMDGLDNRGEVIVIGATNRIDAIDPALRRPGRFDRELHFPLPARKEREEILNVHVGKWSAPPSSQLISYLAENAVGYCGADLRALCSEAVIQSFRRTYPQVYTTEHRLLLEPEKVKVEKVDFLRAKSTMVPASQRIRFGMGRKLLPVLDPILKEPLKNTLQVLEQSFPHGVNPTLAKVKIAAGVRPAQLLLVGDGPEHGQTLHLAPAVLYQMEHIHSYILDLATLHRESGISPEEACIQVFNEARRNVPSVIYIPSIDQLWCLISETVKAIFIAQLTQMDPNIPVLLLATADTVFANLPRQVKDIFSRYRKEVFQINPPNADARREFFRPLIIDACLKQPKLPRMRMQTPPPLPRAPTPPPTPLTEHQAKKVYEQEEKTLRELRIFLRDMCKKLANNKLFYMFTKPVDTEEVPDYTKIIKQPMDLETMMTKVDFHRYECAKDFLSDIELIVQNALEYNPARTSADKQIRHRACSLRDYAYALIKNEMDSDFEEKCQFIAKKRRDRKVSVTQYLPPYINTPDDLALVTTSTNSNADSKNVNSVEHTTPLPNKVSPCRKRKISSWQRGFLNVKRKKRNSKVMPEEAQSSEDESKENNPEPVKLENESPENKSSPPNPTEPLTVNCDISHKLDRTNSPPSPSKRRLSDLLSPSELLDDTLEFDDIDKALNEAVSENKSDVRPVDVNIKELEHVLDQAVKLTANHSMQSLLDLHTQLSRLIKPYSKTHNRGTVPKELLKELSRYKQEHVINKSSAEQTS